ncbi:MAG: hypothetical protein LBV51_03330 [Acholeplasmatales bacterium]|jgi:hypothetical protein|nr:hypothetical protein [Acholeplasmatales bacterium]
MARVQTKKETETSKGENIILRLAIVIASAAVVAFLIWLIITLTKKTNEESVPYESYYSINESDLSKLVGIYTGSEVSYIDFIDNQELYNLLLKDSNKKIYVLLYSSENNYGRSTDAKNKDLAKEVDTLIKKCPVRQNDSGVFLLYNYHQNGLDASVFQFLKSSLVTGTTDSTYELGGLYPQSLLWTKLGGPYLLVFESLEYRISSGIQTDKYKISIYVGIETNTDYFYITNGLKQQLERLISEE